MCLAELQADGDGPELAIARQQVVDIHGLLNEKGRSMSERPWVHEAHGASPRGRRRAEGACEAKAPSGRRRSLPARS